MVCKYTKRVYSGTQEFYPDIQKARKSESEAVESMWLWERGTKLLDRQELFLFLTVLDGFREAGVLISVVQYPDCTWHMCKWISPRWCLWSACPSFLRIGVVPLARKKELGITHVEVCEWHLPMVKMWNLFSIFHSTGWIAISKLADWNYWRVFPNWSTCLGWFLGQGVCRAMVVWCEAKTSPHARKINVSPLKHHAWIFNGTMEAEFHRCHRLCEMSSVTIQILNLSKSKQNQENEDPH